MIDHEAVEKLHRKRLAAKRSAVEAWVNDDVLPQVLEEHEDLDADEIRFSFVN